MAEEEEKKEKISMTTAAAGVVAAIPLTNEQRLIALEGELAKAKAELEEWSALLKKAIRGEEEHKEKKDDYEKERDYWTKERDKILQQIAELRRESAAAEYSQTGVPKWGSQMDFSETLFNTGETTARSLYIRKCYEDMYTEYEPLASPGAHKGSAGVAIIGTPGIGKSGFGLYCLARFASTRPVYYRHKASAPRLIVACQTAVNSVQSVFPEVVRTGVYEVPREIKLDQISVIPGAVAVIDPLLTDLVLPAEMFQVIVSSPDDHKLKEFLKSNRTLRRVMPKWTIEEVRAIVPVHADDAQRLDPVALAELQAQAEIDFEFFGGVPRSIFDADKSRAKVRDQVAAATAASLQRAVESGDSVKGDLGAYLVHTVPDPADPNGMKWEPASRSIGKLLVATLIKRSKDDVKVVFASTSRIPAVQQIRGLALEAAAHDILARGGDFEIADLPSGSASSSMLKFRKISLPPLPHVQFERKDMLDLTVLSENQLAIPMVGNFESVDAFAALRQGLLTGAKKSESTPLSCTGLQTTVADTHGAKGAGLKRVRDKVQQLVGSSRMPISLVFVSESTGISKRQRIINTSGEEYADGFDQTVSQYVIKLGSKFDELVNMYA